MKLKSDSITTSIEQLEKDLVTFSDLLKQIKQDMLAYFEICDEPSTNDKQDVQRQVVPCAVAKTPNQLRVEIIEKAKAFFEANDGSKFEVSINEEKRSVFCWKLVSNGAGYNTIFGLSTCHTNDVYNEYIGKAIALGRALNIDVSEFENAVQPSEVVVGMRTYHKYGHDYWDVTESNIQFIDNQNVIINDTNAIYSEVK